MSKEYFARDALSNSGIKEILKSPRHFQIWKNAPFKYVAAFHVGNGLHTFILQPELITQKIAIFRETKTFQSKAGEIFLAQHEGLICLTLEDYILVERMAESILSEGDVMRLISACDKEREIYGQIDTSHGPIDTKAMLDLINGRVILDLKTTEDPASDFEWAAKRFKYDIQSAWYTDRAEAEDGIQREFYFIVVEKKPPFGVLLYEASPSFITRGRDKCAAAVEIYGRSKALNVWPGYDTRVIRSLN